MNDAAPAFICLLPLVLLFAVGVIVLVVFIALRAAGGRADLFEVSRPMKRFLAFGVPLVFVALGIVGTVTFAEHDAPALLVLAPLVVASILAILAMAGLNRWATGERAGRAHRPRDGYDAHVQVRASMGLPPLLTREEWRARSEAYYRDHPGTPSAGTKGRPANWVVLIVVAVLVMVVVGGFVFTLSRGPSRHEGSVIGGIVAVVVVVPALVVAMLKYAPRWRAKLEQNLRTNAGRPPEPRITILNAIFTSTGGACILGGVLIGGMLAIFMQSIWIGILVGGIFTFCILLMQTSQMRAAARTSATAGGASVVAPLLLTPDPTAVRGDCPTCGHAIPSDSPHGLCPRCLIRGAMPSPSRTRLRGVGPIDPPSPAEVGEFFPHLEVLELIGAGGMGAVYKARQPTLDRIVALKIVQSPRGDEDPVFAERFAREARAMAKLDHPNIVTIHESGEAGGLPFLVMEYVDGITLREAMVNGVLTAVEALAVIPQVCDALDFAHRNGVVHRDIKPENILLDQSGRVKIADFGLAKLADPKNVTLTRTQQAMGTPHYMAPEQWERPNDVDHRADVYALGVVLYELLTGELPLGRFALPSEKGKGDVRLDHVVVTALAKDPAARFQNAGQMKAALSGVQLAAFSPGVITPRRKGFEYRSKTKFLGLPLVHVVAGRDPATGKKRVAKGWLAIGDVMAVGGVAVSGVFSTGLVALGGACGIGLLGVGGGLALGLLAVGGNAAGILFAAGGCAASAGLTIGGVAAGKFAIGGEAAGQYVISDRGQTPGFADALWAWVRGFWPFS